MRSTALLPIFEIHVGFAAGSHHTASRLLKLGQWKLERVSEVRAGLASGGCMDPHDVPGILFELWTMRLNDEEQALRMVEELARRFHDQGDVRIELEQVLRTDLDGMVDPIVNPTQWQPTDTPFISAILIPGTPLYENHFCIRRHDDGPIPYSTQAIMTIVEDASVPIHQGVRFGPDERIILTCFHASMAEILACTTEAASRVRECITALDPALTVKVVTERILLCAQPAALQPAVSV